MTEELKAECKNCRYFMKLYKATEWGSCHFNAPTIGSVESGQMAKFPHINEKNYCGQFTLKSEASDQ